MDGKRFYLLTLKGIDKVNLELDSRGFLKIYETHIYGGAPSRSFYVLPWIEITNMVDGFISSSDRNINGEICGLVHYEKLHWPKTRVGISEGELEKALKGSSAKVLSMAKGIGPFAVYDASVKILRHDILEKIKSCSILESIPDTQS